MLSKKKFEKEQERKKRQIEDYKRRKLEAEELLANADIDFDDEEDYEEAQGQNQIYNQTAGQNNSLLGSHGAHYGSQVPGITKKQGAEEAVDDEDRYLDDIINRNYQKAPPAVV